MAIDMIARALALSGGGGGTGGASDYNSLDNRPQINGITLRGNKTNGDLGVGGIKIVSALPATMTSDTIYIIPGDPSADPPVPDTFYVYEGGHLYSIQYGRVNNVDYGTEIINRPEIDETLLKANNNTHEELELISEKDFTTDYSGRVDGMEFVIPEGVPSNPVPLTEINDLDVFRYADNYTSSNNYINTKLEEVRAALEEKIQMFVVSELPDPPSKNTIYYVESLTPGIYDKYITDSLGDVYHMGDTEIDLDDYVQITRKIGTHTLEDDITTDEILDDIKTAKKIDLSYLKDGVVVNTMPDTPNDHTILTTSGFTASGDDKQDALVDLGMYPDEPSDGSYLDGIFEKNGKLSYQGVTLVGFLNWLMKWFRIAITPQSTDEQVPTAKAVWDCICGVRLTGGNALVYRTTASAGYTISGDYASDTPRQLNMVGRSVNLSFCCKGTAVANNAAWTTVGTVPVGYRPVKRSSIIAQVYNGSVNQMAGGYVDTTGDIVIWTNAKVATNNYQIRVNDCWDCV